MSNGQQWGTVIGGIVGSFFGMTQLGMAVGGMIGGAIDPEVIKAPGIGDAQRQTTMAGVPRPVVYGHPAPFMGNIIDGEAKARKIIVEDDGKGGPVVESERFLLTSAIRICEGPIAGVVRIKRNGEVVYDRRTLEDLPGYEGATYAEVVRNFAELRAYTMAFQNKVRIYLGDETQLPDPALEAIHGVGNTPYYRGTAYMVIEDDDVTDTRGAAAQYEFEVMSVGTEASVVETLPSETTVSAGLFGGGATGLHTDTKVYSEFADLPLPSPIHFELIHGSGYPSSTHRRGIVTAVGGAVLWDSGWISTSPDQVGLDAYLTSIGRADLIASVTSAATVSQSFPVGVFSSDITMQAMVVNLDTTDLGVALEAQRIVPASLPADYTASPELPGAIIGGDGMIYYPDWVTPEDMKTLSAGVVTLGSVVSDIADRCGVPAANIDASALTDIIPGFLIAQQFTGADCIRPCQQMYFFDMPEFDGQIVAVKRGGATVATLSDEDMLEDGADDEDIRAQAIEFPLKVSVVTRDPAADYNPMPQTSARYSSQVQALGETVIQSPIPFSADEAARRADIIHKVLWAQAEGRSQFQLPEEWTRLVPSDCYVRNGKRWMIEKAEYADGAVALKAAYDRATNYTSNATGVAAPLPVLPNSPLRGPTELAVMNLPALREQDNVAGAYLAVTGTMSGWDGCIVQMSVDGGATYRTVATMSRRSVMGRIAGEVGPTTEPIPVTLDDGELYDSTSAELDLGSNAFALVPAAGQSELGQFRTAVEGDPDEYLLTNTRRGVNGTDAATHASGERFVMLAGALFLPIDSSLYGTTLYFRAVTNGTAAENNRAVAFLFEAPPVAAIDFYTTAAGDNYVDGAGNFYTEG